MATSEFGQNCGYQEKRQWAADLAFHPWAIAIRQNVDGTARVRTSGRQAWVRESQCRECRPSGNATAGLLTSNRFENLPAQLYALCRDIYFEELARRAGSAKVFTNTHPGRIIDAAYIASAFPNVRFICVRRELEDNILRIYMRKYKRGNAYAYDPKSTRDYVVWYNQMIDLLVEKLPD